MMQAAEHENMGASDNHQGEHTSAGGRDCNDNTLYSTSIWTVFVMVRIWLGTLVVLIHRIKIKSVTL